MRSWLRTETGWPLCAVWSLTLGCSRQEQAASVGGADRTDAGLAGDAQAALDANTNGLPGNTSDGGPSGSLCPLVDQIYRAATGHCECPVRLPDQCPGACVDLQHDGEHCGDCDTACEPGAGCRAGACTAPPTEVATLTGCMNPRMILSDETFYFSDAGTGTISSMPIVGGVTTRIATDQMLQNPARPTRTSAIAIGTGGIYWSNMGDNTIMKALLPQGTPEVLIELDAPARGLAVGSGMVFFTHHADIFKIPTGGLSADAGLGVPPPEITCDDPGRTAPSAGEPVPGATYVASSNESCIPGGEAAAIALNATELVYTVDVHGALAQNSHQGGMHLPLILGDDVGPARDAVVLNATHAFAAGYSSVLKARLGEAAMYEAIVNAVDSGIVTGFTVTDTHVYVASDRGGISRASITPPSDNTFIVSEQIARDQVNPRWLVNDGTNLYWIGSDCKISSLVMPP